MQYSLSKGLKKGIGTALMVLFSLVVFAGFSDIPVWGLIVRYIQPIVGTMTVGGVLTLAINFVKIKWLS